MSGERKQKKPRKRSLTADRSRGGAWRSRGDDYDLLITNKNASEDFLSQMDEIGVNYIVAEVEV